MRIGASVAVLLIAEATDSGADLGKGLNGVSGTIRASIVDKHDFEHTAGGIHGVGHFSKKR